MLFSSICWIIYHKWHLKRYILLMNRFEIASFIQALDGISYADILDALELNEGEVEFFSEHSGLVFHHNDGIYYIADFGNSVDELIPHIPSKCLASVHGQMVADYMMDELSYEKVEPTYLYLYRGNEFPDVEGICALDSSAVPFICENYSTSSEEDIRNAADNNHLFGMVDEEGRIMAFAGFHEEGSMGILTVLPPYRRMGLGERLEKHLINTALKEGRRAYCNVFLSNSASIALQEKLGLEQGRVLSWWTWRD